MLSFAPSNGADIRAVFFLQALVGLWASGEERIPRCDPYRLYGYAFSESARDRVDYSNHGPGTAGRRKHDSDLAPG